MLDALVSWFVGKDIYIDIFSAVVLAIVLGYAASFVKLNPKREYQFFIAAFALLALSFVFQTLAHFTLYHTTTTVKQMGIITLTTTIIKRQDWIIFWSTLLYRACTLLGLYFLYQVYAAKQRLPLVLFQAYLLLLVGFLSQTAYYAFHLTALILLALVLSSAWKRADTWFLASVGLLLLSQAIFLLLVLGNLVYVAAELVQLLGFVLLLITFILVLRHAKKRTA